MKKSIFTIVFGLVVILSCSSCKFSRQKQEPSASESKSETIQKPSLCPPPNVSGPGTFAGSQNNPISTVNGQVSQLETLTPQIKFNSTQHSVKLSEVWYEGAVTGQYVIPTRWDVKEMSINNKPVTIINSDIKTGCLNTKEYGEILVLFDNSLMSESVTIVMTEDQIKKIN